MRVISRRSGFSLVELLTVIAIIAILAAVIFPVMSRVKETARQNQCITNLHQIGVGIQMFKQDNRKYPAFLGPQPLMSDGTPFAGSGVPLQMESAKNQTSSLYPEYVKASWKLFHCPSSVTTNTQETRACEHADGTVMFTYAYDSYDAYPVSNLNAESRYDVKWAPTLDDVVGSNLKPYPPNTVSDSSDPNIRVEDYARQLRFRTPPGDTVVTWCSYHENRSGGSEPSAWGGRALVLFLDGSVDNIPANEVEQCWWRTRPKKS